MSTQSTTTSTVTSIQLPDLLALVRSFQFDTNRWCRLVTVASEKWVLGEEAQREPAIPILAPDECKSLHATKVGLLAALCFPTLDAPQLRLITDFITLLIYSNKRVFYSKDGASNPWLPELPSDDPEQRGLYLMNAHALLKHIVPNITRITSRSSGNWEDRLNRSMQEYRASQLDVIDQRCTDGAPSLQEYVQVRQKMLGLHVLFDVLELVEGFCIPDAPPDTAGSLVDLKNLTLDIICLALDVFSYNMDQYNGNKYNIVTVLMTTKGLSTQGAMNQVGALIKGAFASFAALEESLLLARPTPTPGSSSPSSNFSIMSWVRDALSAFFPAYSHEPTRIDQLEIVDQDHEIADADIQMFIRRLKHCIVGVVNWGYESELYFGNKGEEIKAFGWIFLNSAAAPAAPTEATV